MNEHADLQINFYHLNDGNFAVPLTMLALKSMALGEKILILTKSELIPEISKELWGYEGDGPREPDIFLAHGSEDNDGHQYAPIWLSSDPKANKIGAEFVALTSGIIPEFNGFKRVFNLFDGSNPAAIQVARKSWKEWSAKPSVICRYFFQNQAGKWVVKQ